MGIHAGGSIGPQKSARIEGTLYFHILYGRIKNLNYVITKIYTRYNQWGTGNPRQAMFSTKVLKQLHGTTRTKIGFPFL